MFDEVPIISINAKIWKFFAFIIDINYKQILTVVPVCILNVGMFLGFGTSLNDIEFLITSAYFTILYFNACLRTIILCVRHRNFELFMEELESMYNEIEQSNDAYAKNVLKDTTKKAQRLAKCNLFLGIFASTCFVSYPVIANQRGLPYRIWLPGLDVYASPTYQIVYALEVLLTITGCCMYIPFSSMMVAYIMFGIVNAKILQHKLKNSCEGNKKPKIILKEIKSCVKYHERIIKYVKWANSLVTYIALFEFLSFGVMLCALLFLVNITKGLAQIAVQASYIFMILYQIYSIYYYANELQLESEKIAQAAYNTPWYNYSVEVQKILLVITIRAQTPLEIMVGNIYPITMEMFQSLVNASYTYFTVLRRFYN